MPTNFDETLDERYAREHRSYLDILAARTPEQMFADELAHHNALAQRDQLLNALKRVKAWDCSGPEFKYAIPHEIRKEMQEAIDQVENTECATTTKTTPKS